MNQGRILEQKRGKGGFRLLFNLKLEPVEEKVRFTFSNITFVWFKRSCWAFDLNYPLLSIKTKLLFLYHFQTKKTYRRCQAFMKRLFLEPDSPIGLNLPEVFNEAIKFTSSKTTKRRRPPPPWFKEGEDPAILAARMKQPPGKNYRFAFTGFLFNFTYFNHYFTSSDAKYPSTGTNLKGIESSFWKWPRITTSSSSTSAHKC